MLNPRYMVFTVSILAALICVIYLPNNLFCEVTQEIIALFGLMMAAVLPTMILTASVLRPGGMSVLRIVQYKNALIDQSKVWAGLFLWSLICCISVVIGKLLGWKLLFSSLYVPFLYGIDFIFLINFVIFLGSFVIILRVSSIIHGIISLIELSANIAISEIQEQNNDILKATQTPVVDPAGHGRMVDLNGDGI